MSKLPPARKVASVNPTLAKFAPLARVVAFLSAAEPKTRVGTSNASASVSKNEVALSTSHFGGWLVQGLYEKKNSPGLQILRQIPPILCEIRGFTSAKYIIAFPPPKLSEADNGGNY